MTNINAGTLLRKISFFNNTLVSDGSGGIDADINPINLLTTWASIRQINASRVAEDLQEGINAVYEIKLRQRAGFNPQSNYTVQWEGKNCEITEITEDVDFKKQWVIVVVNRDTSI